jgi:hypothetical protein
LPRELLLLELWLMILLLLLCLKFLLLQQRLLLLLQLLRFHANVDGELLEPIL